MKSYDMRWVIDCPWWRHSAGACNETLGHTSPPTSPPPTQWTGDHKHQNMQNTQHTPAPSHHRQIIVRRSSILIFLWGREDLLKVLFELKYFWWIIIPSENIYWKTFLRVASCHLTPVTSDASPPGAAAERYFLPPPPPPPFLPLGRERTGLSSPLTSVLQTEVLDHHH